MGRALGFYFRGLTREGANALRARLNDIARDLGYYADRGPTAGRGNVAALLAAIDCGEVALVLLPDELRYWAVHELRRLAQTYEHPSHAEALEMIADAIEAANQRMAEAERDELDEYAIEYEKDALNDHCTDDKNSQ